MFILSFTTIYIIVKNFSSEYLYFSEYSIRIFLFVFWLRNRLTNKYVRNQGNGRGLSKMCTGAYRERGLKNRSQNTYVLNGWLQANVVEYCLCIGLAKYTKASPPIRKLFSSVIIMIILSYAIIRI